MAGEGDGTTPQGGQPDGGNAAPAWVAQLPDPLKAEKAFTSFKTIGDLATDYLNKGKEYESLKGQVANSIPKLPENATPEQREAFFKALGRPESPDKYELPEAVPEGLTFSKPLMDAFRAKAFELGVSQETAKGLLEWHNSFQAEVVKQMEADRLKENAEAETKIKAEFGGDEKYKAIKEVVSRAWKKILKDENADFLTEEHKGPLGNNARLIKLIFNILSKTGEDTGVNPLPGRGPSGQPGINYDRSNMDQYGKGG